jgi:glycosyltransferase involved in cell wall biosynthesis
MLVSIYIPTKDRKELLERAINSVLQQTYDKIEIIVYDDGSTDNTKEYLNGLTNSGKIKAILSTESRGACWARNQAIKQSTGDFLSGLDDDDYFHEDRIKLFVEKWQSLQAEGKKNIAGLFDSINEIYPDKVLVNATLNSVDYMQLRKSNCIGNQIFAPKEYFIEVGMFDIEMPAWQDWDMWTRISKKYGMFLNINNRSYCSDAVHTHHRITNKPNQKIRVAYNRYKNKLGKTSYSENISLLKALYSYHQVIPKVDEILHLLISGSFREPARAIKNFIKNLLH